MRVLLLVSSERRLWGRIEDVLLRLEGVEVRVTRFGDRNLILADDQPDACIGVASAGEPDLVLQLVVFRERFPDARVALIAPDFTRDDLTRLAEAGVMTYLTWDGSAPDQTLTDCLRLFLFDEVVLISAVVAAAFVGMCRDRGLLQVSPGSTLDRVIREAVTSTSLTAREADVAALLVRGYSNQRIADELTIEKTTVVTHVSRVLHKLAAHNRNEVLGKLLEQRPA